MKRTGHENYAMRTMRTLRRDTITFLCWLMEMSSVSITVEITIARDICANRLTSELLPFKPDIITTSMFLKLFYRALKMDINFLINKSFPQEICPNLKYRYLTNHGRGRQ